MQQRAITVGVGVTTLAGYGATAVGIIGFFLVQVLKVDQEQSVVIATAVWTVVAFAVTQIGRYQQAKELAKKAPIQPIQMAGSGSGVSVGQPPTGSRPIPSFAEEEMSREPEEKPTESGTLDPAHETRDIHEAT